jgi:hypothetical protein
MAPLDNFRLFGLNLAGAEDEERATKIVARQPLWVGYMRATAISMAADTCG